jgi:hypothetical protein
MKKSEKIKIKIFYLSNIQPKKSEDLGIQGNAFECLLSGKRACPFLQIFLRKAIFKTLK